MVALPKKRWTVEEYLAFERSSDEKHEFIDGEVYLMAGASRRHNLIALNAAASLHNQLKQRPCEVYAADMRVRVEPDYTYPDVSVVCDPPKFADGEHVDTLLNPMLIVEVLSPSTEMYDRGKKFQKYRTLDSFREYILIAQDEYRIETFLRAEDGRWILSEVTGADAEISLTTIGCTLRLADVYDKVTFEAGEDE
jgi:Uma2 family endonuclease